MFELVYRFWRRKKQKAPMCFTSTTDSPITERSGSSIDRSWIPLNQEKNFHCDMSGCNIGRELLNVSNAISLFLLSSLNCRKKLKCGKSNVRFPYRCCRKKSLKYMIKPILTYAFTIGIFQKYLFNLRCVYWQDYSK